MKYPDPGRHPGHRPDRLRPGRFRRSAEPPRQTATDRKLGTPTIAAVGRTGQTKIVENDKYWEATLKLMRSNVALAAANAGDASAQAAKDETINYLKQLYVRWGRDVGGKSGRPSSRSSARSRSPNSTRTRSASSQRPNRRPPPRRKNATCSAIP